MSFTFQLAIYTYVSKLAVDWVLYARLIETAMDALNEMTHSVLKLIDADIEFDPLPSSPDFHEISDSM